MKNCFIYLVCIVILFFFGFDTIKNTFLVDNINSQRVTSNTLIAPDLKSLDGDLANFSSYSETVHKQLFNHTSYVKKMLSNNLSEMASIIAKAASLDQSPHLGMNCEVLNSAVLILSANMAYADMTCNFLCRLAKLSKSFKYVVIAQDATFYKFLQANKIPSIAGNLMHPISTGRAQKFRSAGFNAISIAKIIAVRIVLELGYNVLFSDVDIAWKKNPISFLSADVDLLIQSNSEKNIFLLDDEPNTGFYFLRSNDRSMALLDDTIDRASKDPRIDDQTHFANALRDWRLSKKAILIMEEKTPPWIYNSYRPFTFKVLDLYQFQNGKVAHKWYSKKITSPDNIKEQDIVLVHANFMFGHRSKKTFLKTHHLWDVNDKTFLGIYSRWKLKSRTKTEIQKQDGEINYQSALDTLRQVCVDLSV